MKERMIMSRTPLRITFVGGGSDLPSFYRSGGPGAVVSATINRYIYVIVNKKFDNRIRVSYSRTEIVDRVEQIEHPTIREALKLLQIDGGIEIVSISDIPSSGTGLGSSSTFLVGLLNALHAYKGEFAPAKQLAEEAVMIERSILNEPGGKQDQYAAAFGGMNLFEFYPDESVSVNPLITREENRKALQDSMLLLYTGINRMSADIHRNQSAYISDKMSTYRKMAEMAHSSFNAVREGDMATLGKFMHENWNLKKTLANGISSGYIDDRYRSSIDAGAFGGKLVGAGGGGFLLLLVPPERRSAVVFAAAPFKEESISLEYAGSRILFVGE